MRPLKSNILQFKALKSTTAFVCSFLLLICMVSCNQDKPDKIGAITDRTKIPKLHATEITTIISDSGITRYRISASRWDVFDKAAQPYQEFPDGIYFEKFDLNMKVDANIQSQYARFNDNEQLWILRGKVRAMNLQGELFETQELFWNQRLAKFYSDKPIKITQATRIITGIGFESNETMTHYMIKNPQGIFPLNDNASASAPPVASPTTSPAKTGTTAPATNQPPKTAPPSITKPIAPPVHKSMPVKVNHALK